jgi:hypothetical protein
VTELSTLTGQLSPVSDERIVRAVEACSADTMRQHTKRRLNDEHLEIFQNQYAELISRLGYEVRAPRSS